MEKSFRLGCARLVLSISFLTFAWETSTFAGNVVNYDIVYVRQPRFGNNSNTTWPEVAHPASMDSGADLVLLHPDGSEEVLVLGGDGAVTDPFVSFDAQWVYYSYFYDQENINPQRGLSYHGADIYRIHLQTRQIQQLTFAENPSNLAAPLPPGEFTPNRGAGNWHQTPDGAYQPNSVPGGFNYLGYGIFNLGPCPLPGGRVAFTSNRNAFVPPKSLTNPTMQLFVMDEDGQNVTPIAPMSIASALHPTILKDGRIMFSTSETQGLRDDRVWGLWSIYPDGRNWGPMVSAFHSGQSMHFMTQLSSEDLVVVDYYNLNNNGFGMLLRFPLAPPYGTPAFHSAFLNQNPGIEYTLNGGLPYSFSMPFTPIGMYSFSPFTTADDSPAPQTGSNPRVGKFTQPSAAPNDDMLVVWTPGPAHDGVHGSPVPYYDAGIYLVPGNLPDAVIDSPNDLVLIKNDANYNEAWPRAIVTYSAVHGVAEPTNIPWLPNDGTLSSALPAGTPYGLVGTSSCYKRESFPGAVSPWDNSFDGLDAFNTGENGQSSNWNFQGSDAGKYSNSDIWAVRLLAMEPNTHRSYGPDEGSFFFNFANERLRILGEIPLRKFDRQGDPILDPEGNPDTSFLAKIPADTPFTFQTIDRNGMALNMAQTWHQLRPGEIRNNCGGCHAHSQAPLHFEQTYAATPSYQIADLTQTTPLITQEFDGTPTTTVVNSRVVNVEFHQDVRPILQSHCVQCHSGPDASAPGRLVLDDTAQYHGVFDLGTGDYRTYPGDYARLARDPNAVWGYEPVIANGTWRQTNSSRYVRMFQSRRSLLMWKVFGQRLDGWTNADHPTESTPGNPATLPPGASANQADLDFNGQICPPEGSGVPPLTIEEKMTLARWIDLGCPINFGTNGTHPKGWFLDEIRPALTISSPRPGINTVPVSGIRIGMADANSGVDLASLSVKADFEIDGRAAGTELGDLTTAVGDGIVQISVNPPLTSAVNKHITARVRDLQGNENRVVQAFSVSTESNCSPSDGDVCSCCQCASGICQAVPVIYGDVNCSGTANANLDDILCCLTGFSSFPQCPNADIAPTCSGNDLINLDDILAVLGAFSGANPCGCSP